MDNPLGAVLYIGIYATLILGMLGISIGLLLAWWQDRK
jgi:hypothetical protein